MKFFHVSDLHIGKLLGSYDITEIQLDVFNQIIEAVKNEKPDAIIMAGDIYDKSAPSGDAFELFNTFLNMFDELEDKPTVLIISGNHDSTLRLNYASTFLKKHKIYIATALPATEDEHIEKVVLSDANGDVNFYLLPFVRPADARNLFPEDVKIATYDDAFMKILGREAVDYQARNVLVAHQFFMASGSETKRCDSEVRYISVGGIDSVDISHVEKFDYVALGHIHTSQKVGREHIRYSGTPVKYSVSEAADEKSITVVELGEKGEKAGISFIPLKMKHDVRKIRGTFDEVIAMAGEGDDDYVSITLTDEDSIFNVKERLNEFYSHILDVTFDNTRTRALMVNDTEDGEKTDVLSLFNDFYLEMNGNPLDEKQLEFMTKIVSELE